ncbi:MAG: hypothetical protein COA67_08665 [Lutibacter sp.]|nr:MAG: hypothetical protein COA67_08665 [Lutibacter sp.]
MKFIKIFIVVFLFFSSDIIAQGKIISDTSSCFQLVTGTVKNKVTNEIIKDATVKLYAQNSLLKTIQTNSKGSFNFKVACDASYQLVSFKGDLSKTTKSFVTSNTGNIRVKFSLLIEEPEKCTITLEGIVKNDEDEFMNESVVIVYDKGKEINRAIVKRDAKYQFILECNKPYKIVAQSVNHIEYSYVQNTGTKNNKIFEKDFSLEKLACIKDLYGEITNANTKIKIADVTIYLLLNGNRIKTTKTNNQGEYLLKNVSCNDNYSMSVSKTNYQKSIFRIAKIESGPKGYFISTPLIPIPKKEIVEVEENIIDAEIKPTIKKEPIIEDTPSSKLLEVGVIQFDLNQSEITREIAIELDKIVTLMIVKPTVNVLLKSHTDSRGPDIYNDNLTEARAQSMVNYIVSNGIDSNRVTGKGYGETELTNECSNGVKCLESAHQANKRNEFIITNE